MKTKPTLPAKPNHVGPVGRKMSCLTQEWNNGEGGLIFAPNHFEGVFPRTEVLVIPLTPANVERIRDVAIQAAVSVTGFETHMEKQIVAAILHRFGLTPAKRKGRKAQ